MTFVSFSNGVIRVPSRIKESATRSEQRDLLKIYEAMHTNVRATRIILWSTAAVVAVLVAVRLPLPHLSTLTVLFCGALYFLYRRELKRSEMKLRKFAEDPYNGARLLYRVLKLDKRPLYNSLAAVALRNIPRGGE